MHYIIILSAMILHVRAGASYQSVHFVNNNFQPIKQAPAQFKPISFPLQHYFSSFSDDVWPTSLFAVPSDFLDISLVAENFEPTSHADNPQAHQFLNELDPELLTGYRAKQAAEYIYGRGELFYKNIPHARLVAKLQTKRSANGLRPNRLGSIDPHSPFYREKFNRFNQQFQY